MRENFAFGKSLVRALWIATLLSAGGLVWACATGIIPATGEKRYLGLTWDQEQEIGKQATKEIAAAFGIYRHPELERYVERVGRRVLQESHLRRPEAAKEFRDAQVTFQILDSSSVNAMAVPGGHIYVTRGLLAHLNNEDQLAVVLAHELGHVTARHAARQVWQQQLGQGLVFGGAIIGQVLGLPAEQILNLGGTAAQLIFLRHSREDELEADKLGVEYSSMAGYDPRAVEGFFNALAQMGEREGAGLPNFLQTHPNPANRVQRIRQLTAELGVARRAKEIHPAAYFEAIEGITLGEDPRHGFVERSTFYHPELRFRFPVPRGFKVVNQPAQVVMVESQQRALVGFRLVSERSAQSAASKFASQPGIRVLETARSQSSALPAALVIADASGQGNQIVRLMTYFVEHRDRVYQFLAYTSPQAFGSFRNEFLNVMRGFGDLSDPQILQRQPVRLEVQRAPRTAPFRQLIPARMPNEMRPEDLAILNQVALNEEVRSGALLKLPGRS